MRRVCGTTITLGLCLYFFVCTIGRHLIRRFLRIKNIYKVCWKDFAASRDLWEPPSSFVPRYTTVWLDYLEKKGISLEVKDVLVHLVMHERD